MVKLAFTRVQGRTTREKAMLNLIIALVYGTYTIPL